MKNRVLLISESTLKSVTLIGDNIDNCYILPAIKISQEIDLESLIGPVLVEKLQYLVDSGDISLEQNKKYKVLLDDYITEYLCWQVATAVQINVNYKITNSGTIQNQDLNKNAIDYQNGKKLMDQFQHYSNAYATKLKNFLDSYISDYPEYTKCKNFEKAEDPLIAGIYLEDRSNIYNYIGR